MFCICTQRYVIPKYISLSTEHIYRIIKLLTKTKISFSISTITTVTRLSPMTTSTHRLIWHTFIYGPCFIQIWQLCARQQFNFLFYINHIFNCLYNNEPWICDNSTGRQSYVFYSSYSLLYFYWQFWHLSYTEAYPCHLVLQHSPCRLHIYFTVRCFVWLLIIQFKFRNVKLLIF